MYANDTYAVSYHIVSFRLKNKVYDFPAMAIVAWLFYATPGDYVMRTQSKRTQACLSVHDISRQLHIESQTD